MAKLPPSGLTLALEDVFDRPDEAAAAGTDFLPRMREGYPGGSPMLTQLRRSGIEPTVTVPSTQLNWGDKGNSPLALAVEQGRVRAGLGLDDFGWLRLAAARHGLYGFRFFHEDWLGRGCFALAASQGGIGCLACERGDMATLGRALLGKSFATGGRPKRILDIGTALQLQDALPVAYSQAIQQWAVSNDVETAAWLLERWRGAEIARNILGSREAAECLRPWLNAYTDTFPVAFREWLKLARDWGEAAVQSAHRQQSEVAAAFREIFGSYDAIATPIQDDMRFADGGLALPRLIQTVDLARLPACMVPLGNGVGVQLIFPNIDRVVIP